MKKKIFFSMCASLLLLASCDYNEDNFPGYDELTNAEEVQNITLTLEDTEYKKIADMDANKELAMSKDPEGETYLSALEAMGKNKFFTDDAPAAWYMPAYISSQYPYLSGGSKVTINYNNFENLPEYLKDFNSVASYELSTDDYKKVWGESLYAPFLSPSTVRQIPNLLAEAVQNPVDGAMQLVNYAYSETEPSTGGGEVPDEPTFTNIADAISQGEGSYDVKGEVVAANARSILVKDDTGIIMVYLNALPTYSLGDVITVSGAISSYKGAPFQFSKDAKIEVISRNKTFEYPAVPKNMTAADMDNYLTTQPIEYVTYEGMLTISEDGKHINVEVDGTAKAIGSIQYPIALDPMLTNKKVKVTGYAVGKSGDVYVSTLATSVVLADDTGTQTLPVGVIALSKAGSFAARGVVSATYTSGFMLSDGTGDILIYEKKAPSVAVGDIVLVNGNTSSYNGLMQFGDTELVVTKESSNSSAVKSLVAQVMDGIRMDEYLTAPRAVYASYTGTLSIKDSGKGFNYYDIEIDGATTAKGSLSYVAEGSVDENLNGKKVIVTGYLIGANKEKNNNVNTMITSVVDASATNLKAYGLTRAASPSPTASAVYRYDATSGVWKKYATSAASVAVLQPSDYAMIGFDYISKPTEVLPIYLQRNYPYAKKDDIMAVVYYADSDKAISATEFVFDGAAWAQTTVSVPTTIVFLKGQGEWVEAKVYYSSSLLDGDDGGFTVQDIELDGLTTIWKIDKKFGWKGSGYSGGNKVTESWLISPEISLKKAAAPVLKFDAAVNHLKSGEMSDYFNIMLSTDYDGDATTATWTTLEIKDLPVGDSWDFVSVTPYDLSVYKDQNIYIAFHYKSDAASAITAEIKNISVQE